MGLVATRSQVNRILGNVLANLTFGSMLRRLWNDCIPTGHGLFDTSDECVQPETVARIFWRFYERAELKLVARYLPSNVDVVELGSSLGVVALRIASRLDSGRALSVSKRTQTCSAASAGISSRSQIVLRQKSSVRLLITRRQQHSHSECRRIVSEVQSSTDESKWTPEARSRFRQHHCARSESGPV